MSVVQYQDQGGQRPSAIAIDTKLEAVVVPVADVERSKRFYVGLGWRLDTDFTIGEDRVVQVTPTGSSCSVIFGKGVTTVVPGSAQGLLLIVDDIQRARSLLVEAGAEVSEVFHFGASLHVTDTQGRLSGPDPESRSYRSWASFADPDGNGWLLQEVKERHAGRGLSLGAVTLTRLLREAEARHRIYQSTAPEHHWSDWYSAYILARARDRAPQEAAQDAARSMNQNFR
jgi:catechol 2,3-dioxygenase-like lactoylglutathione lyase family enzyme